MANQFDVFFSHNTQDKPVVEAIAAHLRTKGFSVWLDRDELRPGLPWQEALGEAIRASRAVAIFVGANLLKSGQELERIAFLDRAAKEGIPVIPVLLPGCPDSPKVTELLQAFTWIDLRSGVTDRGLALLAWGMTGNKPAETGSGIQRPGKLPSESEEAVNTQKSPLKVQARRKAWWLALGALVAIGAGAWLVPWKSRRPDLYEVRVQVLDSEDNLVREAQVRSSTGHHPRRLSEGWWEIQIPAPKVPKDGKVTLSAEKENWESNSTELVLRENQKHRATIRLKVPRTWIHGRVVDGNNRALRGVTITPHDGTPGSAISGVDGSFALQLPVPKERHIGLRAELKGWPPDTAYCYSGRDGCQVILTKP